VPAPPPQNAAVEPLVLPLLNQFSWMQQQMFDQFQQALMQMFKVFGTLHRDQAEALRTELDRQQQLTRELREIQAELSRHPAAAPGRPDRLELADRPAPPPPAPARADQPQPRPPAYTAAPAPAAAARHEQPIPAANDVGQTGQDVHTWLCERMAALQQERQSGWQRMLSFLTGKRSDGATP
jgi:hypothetical protein